MRKLSKILLFILFTTQSIGQSYAEVTEVKDLELESARKYNPHFFDSLNKDNDLYIKNLWTLVKANFKVDLSEKQIEKLSKQIKAALPNMKFYQDNKFIKVGYSGIGQKEYTVSNFNSKDNTFHMNGVKLKIDTEKSFSENIQTMTELMNNHENNNQKQSIFYRIILKDSYAFTGLLLKALGLLLAVLVVPALINSYNATMIEHTFNLLREKCLDRDQTVSYEESLTKKMFDKYMESTYYAEFFNQIKSYKNCLLYVQNVEVESRFSQIQLDSICKLGKEAHRCIEDYKNISKEKATHHTEQNNSRETSPKPTALGF